MADDAKSGNQGPGRRSGGDRRSGSERQAGRLGSLPPFSWFFGRRRSEDRRGGEDRRRSGSGPGRDPGYVKATELTTEPIRLEELAEKSGLSVERLRRAAFGKEKLSAEERAVLTGQRDDEES